MLAQGSCFFRGFISTCCVSPLTTVAWYTNCSVRHCPLRGHSEGPPLQLHPAGGSIINDTPQPNDFEVSDTKTLLEDLQIVKISAKPLYIKLTVEISKYEEEVRKN